MAFEDTLNRHHDCEVVILPRFHKNRLKLIPGLYCNCHAKLIKWLSDTEARDLEQAGVERLSPTNSDRFKLMKKKLKRDMR